MGPATRDGSPRADGAEKTRTPSRNYIIRQSGTKVRPLPGRTPSVCEPQWHYTGICTIVPQHLHISRAVNMSPGVVFTPARYPDGCAQGAVRCTCLVNWYEAAVPYTYPRTQHRGHNQWSAVVQRILKTVFPPVQCRKYRRKRTLMDMINVYIPISIYINFAILLPTGCCLMLILNQKMTH